MRAWLVAVLVATFAWVGTMTAVETIFAEHPVEIQKVDPLPDADLGYTSQEKADVDTIIRLQRVYPNMKWEPEYSKDNGEIIPTLFVTVPDPDVLAQICDGNAAACTYANIPTDLALFWSKQAHQTILPGSCVMFVPPRDAVKPRTWFFLVGHEFMHCRYGNFHPVPQPADGQGE